MTSASWMRSSRKILRAHVLWHGACAGHAPLGADEPDAAWLPDNVLFEGNVGKQIRADLLDEL
jgi:hypothetical protein